ncbi:MAG TPA: kelch repeat-containing protein [Solirubrobacteraceae bacterium]|nr:kelch repeat-containing protein [Solirubrobacteraceae bacterium]
MTPWRDGALALAGLDAADASLGSVTAVNERSARTLATLPAPLHDAAAAGVAGNAYLFGGGNASTASAAIFEVDAAGAHEVAQLPAPASDVAAAAIGGTAYVVGGYTETVPLRTIVAFTPGPPGTAAHVEVAGTLPRPLRYAAVAVVGGRLLIAGGTSGETAERAIYSFDPRDGHVRRIGELPHPLTHAAGASLGGWMYVLGGRGEGLSSQTASILAIDPTRGSVHAAGRLPSALSDIGAASLPGRIIAIGGRDAAGTVSDTALTLAPRAR